MARTDNPRLEYESGQNVRPWEPLSDSGDHKTFEAADAPWSSRSGFEPKVRPWGVATGGAIRPTSNENEVEVQALTAYMPGSAAADANGLASASGTVTITRTTLDATNSHKILSVILEDSGDIEKREGEPGAEFSEQRGEPGGPPYLPLDAIEIGQVRISSESDAPIKTSEIFQVVGLHQERYDSPVWEEKPSSGEVTFATELPLIHREASDDPAETRRVYAHYATPIFAEMPRVSEFEPAEESHSVSSTEIYGGTIGSVSRTLGQASFTHYAQDGITDPIVPLQGENLWFRFFQDRNRTAYMLTQGVLGISRSFPAGEHVQMSVTISASQATENFEG